MMKSILEFLFGAVSCALTMVVSFNSLALVGKTLEPICGVYLAIAAGAVVCVAVSCAMHNWLFDINLRIFHKNFI